MDTRDRILDVAQQLAQSRGFNAFSYADIAEAVGIRTASIHHHFASKEDLERELVVRYRSRFRDRLDAIDREAESAAERIRRYCLLYRATLEGGALCLCGMMASDIAALPSPLRIPLQGFFEDQIAWLTETLDDGIRREEWEGPLGRSLHRAKFVLATLQGGLLIARATNDPAFFDRLPADILRQLRH